MATWQIPRFCAMGCAVVGFLCVPEDQKKVAVVGHSQ